MIFCSNFAFFCLILGWSIFFIYIYWLFVFSLLWIAWTYCSHFSIELTTFFWYMVITGVLTEIANIFFSFAEKLLPFGLQIFFYFFRFYVFMFRERWREEEKHLCGRETGIGCLLCAPYWGPGPHTSECLMGTDRARFLCRAAPNALSLAAQGRIFLFFMYSIEQSFLYMTLVFRFFLAFVML